MSEHPYTLFNDLTPEQLEAVSEIWNRANQFVNEMVVDHILHLEGDECVIEACSSKEFAHLMDELGSSEAKAVAHAAIVRLAKIFKESTDE